MSKKTSSSELFKNTPPKAPEASPESSGNEQEHHTPNNDTHELENKTKALESKVSALEKENLSLIADMANLRRQSEESIKRNRLYANQKIIESLLPALDVLDLALAVPEEQHTIPSLLQGCEMTRSQMTQILMSHGLEKTQTENHTPFNPEEHEAIKTEIHDNLPSQSIIQCYQSGYKLNGRVIRTAKVSINAEQ